MPFTNKGKLECQFQIGYKGMIDLAYRSNEFQTIQAHCVYQGDQFNYELGLNPKLYHKPNMDIDNRGNEIAFYAMYRTTNGGYVFEVMSKRDMDMHSKNYSKAVSGNYSPWNSQYESMAKKTVIKRVLKYAPLKTEFQKALSMDESIKTEIGIDMSEIQNEEVLDGGYVEIEK